MPIIKDAWTVNFRVYGARKVWHELGRQGHEVARGTVERLMAANGMQGVRRGKVVKTTVPDGKALFPLDLVNRQFHADRPNRLWVADFSYVSTWQGWVYVAFVVDVFACRIVGWRMSSSMTSDFALVALEQAIYARKADDDKDLVHHSEEGRSTCQYAVPSGCLTLGLRPLSAPRATVMTMHWLRLLMGFIRVN